MIAANAQIGVARAAYFPQITLTATPGFQSRVAHRTSLTARPACGHSAGTISQPIFTAGKLRSGVRLAEAQQQEALLVYQQTIQGAFRSVSDSLVGYRKIRNSVRSRNCSPTPRRMRRSFPTSDIGRAPRTIWKC